MKITRWTQFEDLPEYLTIDELRAFLDLGKTTAYELIRTGEIPHRRFGRRIFIPKDVLSPSHFTTEGD